MSTLVQAHWITDVRIGVRTVNAGFGSAFQTLDVIATDKSGNETQLCLFISNDCRIESSIPVSDTVTEAA